VGRVEIGGEDRRRFLNGLVTCEVKELPAGEGRYGYLTGGQGKILADVVVLGLEDRLWVELPAGRTEEVVAHLRKYVVADRVEIRPLAEMVPLLVAGPRAKEVLDGEELPGNLWGHRKVSLGGTEARVVRLGRLGVEAFSVWVSASVVGTVWEWLLAKGAGLPKVLRGPSGAAAPVGYEALEVARVEGGIGRCGQDFGDANFPQETGEEAEAVSYTKGCYLGQEIVARIHYRGGVQNALRGLLLPSSPAGAAPVGTPLFFDGREVGRLTSAVSSPRLGRPVGLAVLHRRGWDPGTMVRLGPGEDAAEAEVVEVPFAR
jgi:folate-binding protein YgfZ